MTEDPLGAIVNCKVDKVIVPLGTTSIVVKVLDEQRKMHFREPIEQIPPSERYLNAGEKKTYRFKEIKGGVFSGGKKMADMVPKHWKKDLPGFNKHIKYRFKEFMGLE